MESIEYSSPLSMKVLSVISCMVDIMVSVEEDVSIIPLMKVSIVNSDKFSHTLAFRVTEETALLALALLPSQS
jgi:hypothetical protein